MTLFPGRSSKSIPLALLAIATLGVVILLATAGASAQSSCIQALTSTTVESRWSDECDSENRDDAYARFYTFTLAEWAEVAITLESETDPYLFLLDVEGEDIAENGGNYNSIIEATLDAGNYTKEVTTYDRPATGDFTLTVSRVNIGEEVQPTPDPTCTPAPDDRAASLTLYSSTNGANWTHSDNWLSDRPIGESRGVTTDVEGRVIEPDTSSNPLKGKIPAELGSLSSPQLLSLFSNELSSEIASELGTLAKSELVNLAENDIVGCIPEVLHGVLINDLDEIGPPYCDAQTLIDTPEPTPTPHSARGNYTLTTRVRAEACAGARYANTVLKGPDEVSSLPLINSG